MSHFLRYVILTLLIVLLVLLNLIIGPVDFAVGEIISVLFGGESRADGPLRSILFQVRIPEILTASLVGASLGVCGLVMQTMFRNPLAGPSVLGLSSGASLGASVVLLAGSGLLTQVSASIIGTVVVLFIILAASLRVRSVTALLILGMMLGYVISSIVTFLQFYSQDKNIADLVFWGMGSFSSLSDVQITILAILMPIMIIVLSIGARPMDTYLLGEEEASVLGVNVKLWRFIIIGVVGIMVGVITAYCGPIAFIGLAVPHMARLFFKSSLHRVLIPGTLLCGTVVALFANLISGLSIFSSGLPLNAVLSVIGAPLVIWLVMNRKSSNMLS